MINHGQPQRSLLLFGPGAHFGAQLARRFAREGFAVCLVGRTRAHIDSLVTQLQDEGASAIGAAADVTNATQLREVVADLARALPPIRCGIYNVKASPPGTAIDLDPNAFVACMAANVGGALAAIQATRPWLQGKRAVFVLTGGGYKDRPCANKVALSASKAALHSLVRSAAPLLRHHHIELRTVVIDGVVREKGPLLPEEVADCFWSAYEHPTRRVFRLEPKSRATEGSQLPLFSGSRSGGVGWTS